MSNLDKLITHFEKFPGIGGRQARRFAFHILRMAESDTKELAELITNLQAAVVECTSCHRFFAKNGGTQSACDLCINPNRNRAKLLVIAADSDIVPIERAGVYDGLYFVLGGTIPLLDTTEHKLRGGALKALVESRITTDRLDEIILGFAVNPDGENTGRYVESLLKDFTTLNHLTITKLGRGLSTGSELEYADPETIKNALQNRT